MKLGNIMTALAIFAATTAQATPEVDLNESGDIAEFVIDNTTNTSCFVDYEIEAKYRLTSSSSSRWHVVEYGIARIKANHEFTKEIYHRGAEDWRLTIKDKGCG